MSHDYDSQRAETEATFAALVSQVSVPETIDLDIHFMATRAGSDMGSFIRVAKAAGYEAELFEDLGTVELSVSIDAPDADRIWEAERRATEIALDYGLEPDGWGFHAEALRSGGGLFSRIASLFSRG